MLLVDPRSGAGTGLHTNRGNAGETENTGIRDEQAPFPYSTVVFRDPDNIQLELFWSAS